MKDSDVAAVAVEHLEGQLEVFPLITVTDEEGLGRAVVPPVQGELLHVQVRVANPDESAQLAALLRLPQPGIAWYCMILLGTQWYCKVLYGIA